MMGRWESESPPVRSQLRANGSQGQGELTAVTVERLAWRIVELVSDRIVDVVADAVTQAPDLPTRRLVDAATMAQRCGVERLQPPGTWQGRISAPRPMRSQPLACGTLVCRNATVYEICSVCRPVLLWSRGRPVCATRDRAGWGKAS
jgi:hypothetical protein